MTIAQPGLIYCRAAYVEAGIAPNMPVCSCREGQCAVRQVGKGATWTPAAATLAPPGDCAYCDTRRSRAAASMQRKRARDKKEETP